MKVVVLTSAHPRADIRIFVKQCRSLAAAGHQVTLVVADGLGDAVVDGIAIKDVGKPVGRLRRMTQGIWRVGRAAWQLQADVYHFHDPELIPVGLLLRLDDRRVVYDVHEDVPRQILAKPWIRPMLRRAIARAFEWVEDWAAGCFSAVVAATPTIRDRFLPHQPQTVDVNNFPILSELTPAGDWHAKEHAVCYLGGITRVRGIMEALDALTQTDSRLLLAGAFNEAVLEQEARAHPGWLQTEYLGVVDRAGVQQVLGRARVGLVTLHPIINYLDALPIKLFEYMAAGIPVVASDFPLWRQIVQDADCGLCVDPLDPGAIAKAIRALLADEARALELGRNGRRAVEQHYQWSVEAEKLLTLYRRLAQALAA